MVMTRSTRNVVLTAHVTSSVGWLGAVAVFLTLAVVGLSSKNAQFVRAAYLASDLTAWFVIVPLCGASVLTGLVSSLATTWGLFRHFWVVAKLLMTIPASILLLVHMPTIDRLARIALVNPLSIADFAMLRAQLVFEASAAFLVLLTATALSVYKPAGRTQAKA